jgi:hypothetical protein
MGVSAPRNYFFQYENIENIKPKLSEYTQRTKITPEREVENNNIKWKKALNLQALMCITPIPLEPSMEEI